jgi:hypothetical protein
VLQIAQAKRKAPEGRSQILTTRSSRKNSVYTTQTNMSDATNDSRSIKSETQRSQSSEKRTFLNSGTTRGGISFANNHSKTDSAEANGNKISKEMTELSECCKGCSSVEEFLKHLIWNEETDSESFRG